MPKEYLGDGAYVDYDGFCIILTTSDGIVDTNTIYLEPTVFITLEKYVHKLRTMLEADSKVL